MTLRTGCGWPCEPGPVIAGQLPGGRGRPQGAADGDGGGARAAAAGLGVLAVLTGAGALAVQVAARERDDVGAPAGPAPRGCGRATRRVPLGARSP